MPFSFHSHSGEFCLHAEDSLESVIQSAINNGFTHYGLTEHMPRIDEKHLYEEENHLKPRELMEMFKKFVTKARQLQLQYADHINILVGMETEYIDERYIDLIKEIQKKYKLDFAVGSLHYSFELPIDLDFDHFQEVVKLKGLNELLHDYFDKQYILMKEIQPLVIGHFDVIFKYCDHQFDIPDDVMKKITRNIDYAIGYGALFELNSSAFGYEKKHPYPRAEILKVIKEMNGKFTISDDAHGNQAVGQYYDQLYNCIKQNKIYNIYYLEYDHKTKTVSECREDNIIDHDFWKTFEWD